MHSTTAAVNLVVPVLLGLATASNASGAPLAVAATLGAILVFMLPAATPPNALVFGSGFVPVRDMICSGFLLDVAGAVTTWPVIMTLGKWVLPD